MMDLSDRNTRDVCAKYGITEVRTQPEQHCTVDYEYYQSGNLRYYKEQMLDIKISASGFNHLVNELSQIENNQKVLCIPQVRTAYEKYQVIKSLFEGYIK